MRHLICLAALISAPLAFGQQSVLQNGKTGQPPKIDGIIDEQEWAGSPSVNGGYDEQTGEAMPAEFAQRYWLSYDDKFIYIAAKLADPDPKQIRATEFRTNVSVRGDDFFIFFVDPFGTLADANQFEINPHGASNIRIAGGRAAKREWLGEIESKGRITEAGWEAEARIPWSILRLPPAGRRDLRAGFGRVVARNSRAYIVDNISGGRVDNIGVWKEVDVPKPDTRRAVKLLPFGYGGWDEDTEGVANAGLDFKAPLSAELDLVGTVNPDFRNIENQVLSLDFSYFERLAGESRPFFSEGQAYFRTSMDAPLFAPQRIRNFDFGGKVYGKLGDRTTVGILDTADFGNQNAFVGSVTHSINTRSSATFAVASLDRPDVANQGTFLSASHGVGPLILFGQHMSTSDTHLGAGERFNTGVVVEGYQGLSGSLEYASVSPDFLPRLGFVRERGFKGVSSRLQYGRPVKWGQVSEVGGGISVDSLDKYSGGGMYRKRASANLGTTLVDGTDFRVFSEVQEFAGFKDRLFYFSVTRPRGDPYRNARISYATGVIAGRRYESFQPGISYRPWQHFQVHLSFQRVNHFTSQEQAILNLNYDLNATEAVSGRMVSRDGKTNFYLAWRRAGNKGAEYYVILGDPNAATFRTSLVLKAVFPFDLRF